MITLELCIRLFDYNPPWQLSGFDYRWRHVCVEQAVKNKGLWSWGPGCCLRKSAVRTQDTTWEDIEKVEESGRPTSLNPKDLEPALVNRAIYCLAYLSAF